MLSFSQCDIFPQWLYNSLYNNISSISSTYTYDIVYNYTTQYTDFAVYISCPFHNVNIFYTLLYNCLYDNVYIESSLLHTVLYTITPPGILTVLFTYASFSQCDIFSQSLYNWLYNNVYSISATYTYSTVCNYSPKLTGFAVYICFPFHNVIFFYNDCTIHSTTMFTAYPQHIHAVLFTITLPSTLTLLFI